MDIIVKNALESVFAKLSALSQDDFKKGLSNFKDSDLSLSLAGFFTFCQSTLNKIDIRIEQLQDFEVPELEYREAIAALNAANDYSYLMAA